MKQSPFKQFFNLSPEPLGILDLDGNFLKINSVIWQRIFGWHPSDLKSKSYLEIVHPNDLIKTSKILTKLKVSSGSLKWENKILLKSGGQIDFSWEGVWESMDSHIFIFGKPLSKEKVSSNENFKQHQRFARIINSLPILIAQWSRELRIVNANRAYVEYFGKTPEAIKGLHISDVIGASMFKENFLHIEAVLRGEPQVFERTIPFSNDLKYSMVYYFPDILNDEVNGFFVFITDVTKIKVLENERRTIESKLIFASKRSMIGEMVGSIAHEINTPLCSISMLADRLTEILKHDKVNNINFFHYIENIGKASSRISEIIKGLQTITTDESNDPLESVSISTILRKVVTLTAQRFKHKGIQLKIHKIPDNLTIFAQKSQVIQVLIHLLNNAYDAIVDQQDPWIELLSSNRNNCVSISVIDSGNGISKCIQDKLMQPFFTTKEVGKGAGLGLYISLGIMQQHGGTLKLDTKHRNTCFTILFPQSLNKCINRR